MLLPLSVETAMTEPEFEAALARLQGRVAALEEQQESQHKHWHGWALLFCFCAVAISTVSLLYGKKLGMSDMAPLLLFMGLACQVPRPRQFASMSVKEWFSWLCSPRPTA